GYGPRRYSERVMVRCTGFGWAWLVVLAAFVASDCRDRSRPYREFPMKGQVLSVGKTGSNGWREFSIKHDDIVGFMPAMTMAYYVRQPSSFPDLGSRYLRSDEHRF